MLAGVGGRTIEEAQRNISFDEFLRWVAYRTKYGPLSTARRVEDSLAMSMLLVHRLHGGKLGIEAFYPHGPAKASPQTPIDLETALEQWE